MFYSERDAIDIYERKYSIQEIWWMDEDDRLLFAPVRRNRNRIRNIVRNAVEAALFRRAASGAVSGVDITKKDDGSSSSG